MSGDWFKIENATCMKPEIFNIADFLKISPDEALGKCVRFWSWVDQQSTDGSLLTSAEFVDSHVIHFPCFCEALQSVGWLKIFSSPSRRSAKRLEVPNFNRYFGACAKVRKSNGERQMRFRNGKVTRDISVMSQENNAKPLLFSVCDSSLNKDVKEGVGGREGSFDEFWTAYPRKVWKAKALEAWCAIDGDITSDLLKRILDALAIQKRSDQWKRGVIPNPSTWICGRGWENVIHVNGNVEPMKSREEREAEVLAKRAADAAAKKEAKKSFGRA